MIEFKNQIKFLMKNDEFDEMLAEYIQFIVENKFLHESDVQIIKKTVFERLNGPRTDVMSQLYPSL